MRADSAQQGRGGGMKGRDEGLEETGLLAKQEAARAASSEQSLEFF